MPWAPQRWGVAALPSGQHDGARTAAPACQRAPYRGRDGIETKPLQLFEGPIRAKPNVLSTDLSFTHTF
jgi:hypothetical protein